MILCLKTFENIGFRLSQMSAHSDRLIRRINKSMTIAFSPFAVQWGSRQRFLFSPAKFVSAIVQLITKVRFCESLEGILNQHQQGRPYQEAVPCVKDLVTLLLPNLPLPPPPPTPFFHLVSPPPSKRWAEKVKHNEKMILRNFRSNNCVYGRVRVCLSVCVCVRACNVEVVLVL